MSTTPSMFPEDPPPPPPKRPPPPPKRPAPPPKRPRLPRVAQHQRPAAVLAPPRPKPPQVYDLTAEIRAVVCKLVQLESLRHIDPGQLLIGVSIARSRANHGVMASCMPLRFDGGNRQLTQPSGRVWEWPKVEWEGREVLYNLTFSVPRFLNNTLAFKLETVVHELFHISPKFDGTLRVLGSGRHRHHGPSRAYYDRLIRPIWTEAMREFDLSQYVFLNRQTDWIRRKFGGLAGIRASRLGPRLVAGSAGGSEAPPVEWEHGDGE